MRSALVLAFSGCLGFATATQLSAQQPGERPTAPEEVIRLPEVKVSAPARLPGAPLPLSHIPSTVDVVPGEAIRDSGAVGLQDYLTRLPGVTLNDEQGNRAQPDISFRGFQATPVTGVPQGISVFVDGVRVNEPAVEEVNFDLIPLEDIERIEIIRGPSAVFGRNTLGGALNIITRRGQEVREFEPELGGGSFGLRKYRLRLSGPASPFDYYLSGSLLEEDGWRDVSAVRLGKLFAKLGFRFGDTDATVSFQRAENRIEQPGSLPLSELRRDRTLNFTSGDFFKPLLNLATLNLRQQVTENASLSVNAFGRTLDAEQFNVNLLGDNPRSFNHITSAGTTIQFDHDAVVLGRANRLTTGLEYVHHDVAVTVFEEKRDTGERVLNSKVRDDEHGFALYLQNTFDLAKNVLGSGDVLVLTVGARWDWLRHAIDDLSPAGERPSAAGTATFSRANPRIGLNYNVSRAANVYFSFAQGFRAPAFLELTCAGPGAVCPGLQAGVAPDPPLRPVAANHYEVGARLEARPWLGLNAAAFRTDVRDDIFSVSPTGTTGLFFQNVGGTRRQGFELAAQATITKQWQPRVSYTYTEATFRDEVDLATPRVTPGCTATPCTQRVRQGNDLPLVPRHRLNAGVDYHITPWLTLWLSGAYVGAQRLRGDEENVARTLRPYAVLNGGARLRWKSLTAFLTINNLLNEEYETFGTFALNAKVPGTPVERFLTPAPPVNVVGGLSYRF
jgi:iron complex outermembrane recepter protein